MPQTVDAKLLKADYQREYGLHREAGIELWHVTGITSWTDNNTVDRVYKQIPRALGQVCPGLTNAILLNYRLQEKINTGQTDSTDGPICEAIVSLHYDSTNNESFRIRSRGLGGYRDRVVAPYWSYNGASWQLTEKMLPRQCLRRVETRYVRNGSVTESNIRAINAKIGWVFHFPRVLSPDPAGQGPDPNAIPYVLMPPSIVDLSNGLTRVVYTFESSCRMRGIQLGRISGVDVALPPLDYLQEWYAPFSFKTDGSRQPSDIQVVPWWDLYYRDPSESLPFIDS